jgi:RecB family exonuclease
MTVLPEARRIDVLSPSRAEAIRTCPLKVAFSQAGSRTGSTSDPARIGNICHDTLEALVRDHGFEAPPTREDLQAAWEHAASLDAARHPQLPAPRRWTLALARLGNIVNRLAEVVAAMPREAELCTEVDLRNRDGSLFGRADLVARWDSGSTLIDYKTGSATDRATGELRDSYARQLRLYAFLEHETRGVWPERAILLPFVGDPVEVSIDPDECEATAEAALAAVASYNLIAGSIPPATPSATACGWCDAAATCSAFWGACDERWLEAGVSAAQGPVVLAKATPLGGLSLQLASTRGSLHGELSVRGLDADLEAELPAGVTISLVGLRPDRAAGGLAPTPHLRIAIEP